MKSVAEMSDQELLEEIAALRDRRLNRKAAAAEGHRTRKTGEPTAKPPKKVDPGLSDVLGQILNSDEAVDAFNMALGIESPTEENGNGSDDPTPA